MKSGVPSQMRSPMRSLRSIIALTLLASPALGQTAPTLPDPPAVQGSPGFLAAAVSFVNGGGRASSSVFAAEVNLSTPMSPGFAASSLYRIEGGVVAVGPDLTPSAPLLASVSPPIVSGAGGDFVTLHGLALAPGGLAPVVRFGGQPSPLVSVTPSGVVTAITPQLLDAFGNPRGQVEVEVMTTAGTASLTDAVIAGPAYLQTSAARLGGEFSLTHHATPFGLGVPSWGLALPSGAIPIPGYGGALTIFPVFQTAPSEPLDSSGISSTAWPIPDLPQLVGRTLDFQSFVFESLITFSGSFTNLVSVVIEP